MIGLTRSAALDAQGIRINAVCPGMVNTPMAAFVTKNYDPEIVRQWWRKNPSDASSPPN
jgi:NAD(P)-dependent dehydrogenase (short-subunit alcohol dehydrogenase family)